MIWLLLTHLAIGMVFTIFLYNAAPGGIRNLRFKRWRSEDYYLFFFIAFCWPLFLFNLLYNAWKDRN
jgi:hypothetical protein